MPNCLYQPIKFRRTKKSKWEAGSLYIYINSNYTVIEDENKNEISVDDVYDYKANWF